MAQGTQVISEFEDAASNTYNPGTTPGQMGSDSLSAMLYQHPDHLTTRLTTDNNGDVANHQGHYPFGETWYNVGTADPSVLRKFTTYEKETEVSAGQLHYAVFREHGARVGRFHMADPVPGSTRNPQSWNRYAYVAGDPTNRTDRLGLLVGITDSGWCSPAAGNCGAFDWMHVDDWAVGGRFAPARVTHIARALQAHEYMVNRIIEESWLRNNFVVERGPGGVYYSRYMAMAAAAMVNAEAARSDSVVREYWSFLIEVDGVFTYGESRPGEPCTAMPGGQWDCKTFVPAEFSGDVFGIAHTHPDDTPFSGKDELTLYGHGRPIWGALAPMGIPGQILIFDPITLTECVLVGPTNWITPNRCQ